MRKAKVTKRNIWIFGNNHDENVVEAKSLLLKKLKLKDGRIIINKPLADMILIDFDKKRIIAIEVSQKSQKKQKLGNYKLCDYDSLILVRKRLGRNKLKYEIIDL